MNSKFLPLQGGAMALVTILALSACAPISVEPAGSTPSDASSSAGTSTTESVEPTNLDTPSANDDEPTSGEKWSSFEEINELLCQHPKQTEDVDEDSIMGRHGVLRSGGCYDGYSVLEFSDRSQLLSYAEQTARDGFLRVTTSSRFMIIVQESKLEPGVLRYSTLYGWTRLDSDGRPVADESTASTDWDEVTKTQRVADELCDEKRKFRVVQDNPTRWNQWGVNQRLTCEGGSIEVLRFDDVSGMEAYALNASNADGLLAKVNDHILIATWLQKSGVQAVADELGWEILS